jgi:8-oxo-dGTP diphosphatase
MPSMRSVNSAIPFSPFSLMILALIRCMNADFVSTRYASVRWPSMLKADQMPEAIQREFPQAPIVGVGAVIVDAGRVLLVRRGREPLKGKWSLPGGMLELGESLHQGLVREVEEETGLQVAPLELIELLDRIVREESPSGERVRFHYVIADYLCRVLGGSLKAASDAEAVRWAERNEWNSHSSLALDPITVRVIEAGWQRAAAIEREKSR